MRRCEKLRISMLILLVILLSGCITPSSHVVISPLVDFSSVKTIAVWKFRDGGRVPNSGDIATRAIESALMMKGFRVFAYSKIRDIVAVEVRLKEGMALDAGMLTQHLLQRIHKETGVDILVLGSVNDAFYDPKYMPSCWFECSFQMIDIKTGEVIVSANVSDEAWSLQNAAKKMAEKAVNKISR